MCHKMTIRILQNDARCHCGLGDQHWKPLGFTSCETAAHGSWSSEHSTRLKQLAAAGAKCTLTAKLPWPSCPTTAHTAARCTSDSAVQRLPRPVARGALLEALEPAFLSAAAAAAAFAALVFFMRSFTSLQCRPAMLHWARNQQSKVVAIGYAHAILTFGILCISRQPMSQQNMQHSTAHRRAASRDAWRCSGFSARFFWIT